MVNAFFMSSGPSPPPDKVTAYNTSSTSLVVTWSHLPRKYFRGEPIGYIVFYICRMQRKYVYVNVNFTTNTITLSNLHVYTKYLVAVRALSSGGQGNAKSTFAFTGEIRLSPLPYK